MLKRGMFSVMVTLGVVIASCSTGVDVIDNLINDPMAFDVNFTDATPNQSRIGTSTTGTEFESDSRCPGFFPAVANHVLDIDASTGLEVRITGDEGVIAALVVGQNRFCTTPEDPLNRFFTRGELEIFVGSANPGETVNYELEFVR